MKSMTVAELIALLNKYDPNTPLGVQDSNTDEVYALQVELRDSDDKDHPCLVMVSHVDVWP